MKIVDSKGRLFGTISILDLGAACVILLVIIGIFFFPGTSGTSIAGSGTGMKPIEVDAIVRGLGIRDPKVLLSEFDKANKANLIIRKQPHGQIDIKAVKQLTRTVTVPQPDGTVKALPDPKADAYATDLLLTLAGKAQITKNGAVLGGEKIKIGVPIELEGFNYSFNATIIDVRIKE
ncbi:pyruvate/2-oxoglutarate dehydrogenase complex,dihydrolipoamide dehydrogenase (E3) component [Hydrococcus rivularis NIES-593]|uniref:Pyruvate/2-oxoglutarate dehydrogenase complex,dihydrolipoamide dehydrogenase (E3) component n=1 Tax=Hydrococcus rivularis NIES-593 TaxID=1921803 RepID=A0A1U7HNW0_9CYAN|nr:DUF4330 domain-containing protein [Hydrococcus rivularis]OKH25234.1 pyruvate/2-oxoglutarate dehydrogenase complex,dihydrolipoamide dehydrogenase (E3) component [Hydrococcus rivularis NIES-593]